jgi:tetratricopeptide (TPR) repeat protein
LELRTQAAKWLDRGRKTLEPDRSGHYDDAMLLLREVVKNPIGNMDYVAWFEIGWLLWRHERKYKEAEEAFRLAARRSSDNADEYHILSVRHLAEMEYLQGNHEGAWQTIQRILPMVSSHDAPFDAARYAAKLGRKDDMLRLLDVSINRHPLVIVNMFSEPDFE